MNARELAVKIIRSSDAGSDFVDFHLARALESHSLMGRDRALLLELVNGTYRWRGTLDWVLNTLCQKGLRSCPPMIVPILETALYQLMFLDKIPHYAATDEAVRLATSSVNAQWGGVVNAVLRNYLRHRNRIEWPAIEDNPADAISIRYSHPLWLVTRWVSRLGVDETIRLCRANNSIPKITLRLNYLAGSRQKLLAEIGKYTEYQESPYNEQFITLNTHSTEMSTFLPLMSGLCSVQDVSAGFPVLLLDPGPGDRIVDLCAAPGGKATYITEKALGHATIFAIDSSIERTKLIKMNCTRLKITSIYPIVADGRVSPIHGVDKVLVDAPCTGLGVLSKRADLRWRRTEQDLHRIVQLQRQLLSKASHIIKADGVIVYSTCSIEPEENEQIIDHFLLEHRDFQIDDAENFIPPPLVDEKGYVKTFPHLHGMDGSFSVRLCRN